MAIDVSSPDQAATRPQKLSTLPAVLQWRAINQPSEVAFTFLVDGEDETLSFTYAELDREARAIAAELERLAPRGSRTLLVFDSGLDYIAALVRLPVCRHRGGAGLSPRSVSHRPHPAAFAVDRGRRPGRVIAGDASDAELGRIAVSFRARA